MRRGSDARVLELVFTLLLFQPAGATPLTCIAQRTQFADKAETVTGLERALSELQLQLDEARRKMEESQLGLTACERVAASTASPSSSIHASSDPSKASKTRARPSRRGGDEEDEEAHNWHYAVQCHGVNSSNTDLSCNCLGLPMAEEFDSRPTIKIIVASWTAAAIDAFLLKIVLEEYMGYPVKLVEDKFLTYAAADDCIDADGTLRIAGCDYKPDPAGVFDAFEAMTEIKDSEGRATGVAAAHIYPEASIPP